MVKLFYALISLLFSLGLSHLASADVTPERSVRIIGRESANVTTPQIYLQDLATVSSKKISDEDAVIALQKIVIANSPLPGQKLTLSAQEILEKLRSNGVDLQQVGFYLKRVITVERAARVLSAAEVRTAIEEYLKDNYDNTVLRTLQYRNNVKVAPGLVNFTISSFNGKVAGQMVFNVTASVNDEPGTTFQVKGVVDEWRDLPVAARPLRKGAVIGLEDITMAHLNVKSLPSDAAFDSDGLVGLEIANSISVGEVFRRNKLSLPPVIEKGSVITILYNKGNLTATASGVALSDAGEGEEIRVKNSASKKVILGRVIEAGLVGVN